MIRNAINRARARREDESGFTLIELLIVIVILGILAAVVVFSVRGITDRGEAAACKTEVRTVETALEAAYAVSEDGGYPDDLDALVAAGFLKSKPTKYVTGFNSTTGVVASEDCDNL